jgi:hypothetical protein
MKPSKGTKRRQFSNKKTRRLKRRGGMHKRTPEQLATAYAIKRANTRAKESAAAHAVLMGRLGISPSDRLATLTSAAALPDLVTAKLVASDPQMSLWSLQRHAPNVTGREHIPAMFEAADMFRQAEQLCSRVKDLTDAEMWNRLEWGSITCRPAAKRMCEDAVHLYEGAIERKYLPAYAPLAWMMSYSDPEKSLRLCNECIAACDARSGVRFARKARIDCIALRAYLKYKHDMALHDELEMATPFPGGPEYMEAVPAMKAPSIDELHEIAIESMAEGSKYGYALQWLLLSYDFERDETEQDQALKTAEEMGLDFERCRICLQ